jgi:surface antigen
VALLCLLRFSASPATANGVGHMHIKGNSTASEEAVGVIVEVEADPHTACSATVDKARYSRSLPRLALGASAAGYWQWQVNRHVTAGRWKVTVTCSGSGWRETAHAMFPAVAGIGRGSAKELFVPGSLKSGPVSKSRGGGEGGGGGEDLYPRGQCTWWVAMQRPDLPWFPGAAGNALNWAKSAKKAGFPTGTTPEPGAVAVFQPGQYKAGKYGHVAYVLSVSGKTMTVSEDNFLSHKPEIHSVQWNGLTFIYKKSSPSPSLQPAPPADITLPQVTGNTKVGETITCTPGSWSGAPTLYAYQWLRDDTAILGATGAAYKVQVADEGHAISCQVTAANSAGSRTATSTGGVVPSLPARTGAPEVSGTAEVGETLICSSGSWAGSPILGYSYQWLRDGTTIIDATENTYKVQTVDEGHVITCEVTATNAAGSTSATSAGRSVPSLPVNVSAPQISGTALVGELLICAPGSWTGSPAPNLTYQWERNGTAIPGAVVSIYTVQAADEGQIVSCVVTGTNAAGSSTTAGSSVTVPSLPVNRTPPSVGGAPDVGDLLTCSSGAWTGTPPPTYGYQWLRDGTTIADSATSSYRVQLPDEGEVISCDVMATNTAGSRTATSSGVSVPSLPMNHALPGLVGVPKAGDMLECSAGTWSGSPAPTYTYQWLRDGSAILSATDNTYGVQAADEGHLLSCEVNATNTAGSRKATSAGLAIPEEVSEREEKEKAVITSVDNTKGDVAPYEGVFEVASQKFTAKSDTITYAGVTVADPNLPVGASEDEITLKLCDTARCTGTTLASEEASVDNYGLTATDFKSGISVTPGDTYYLVWTPPLNTHGSEWLTFWHGGTPHIAGSSEMEAVVRGYDKTSGGPRREIVSYLGTQAPPAPRDGAFAYAFQNFEAASNRITRLAAVVGNPKLTRSREAPEKIDLQLCTTPTCAGGALVGREVNIINYGVTEVRFKGVTVIPGETYYIYWEAPAKYEGEPWLAFWLGNGPLEDATAVKAFAEGYDEGSLTYEPSYFVEKPEGDGIGTFKDYENASGEGKEINVAEPVQVACKVFAPQIESVEPEGYWYRIHSMPWNDEYYAAANAFLNGGTIGEPVDTDPDVPDC